MYSVNCFVFMREALREACRVVGQDVSLGILLSPQFNQCYFSQLLIFQLQGISLRFPSAGKMSKRCTAVDFYVIY